MKSAVLSLLPLLVLHGAARAQSEAPPAWGRITTPKNAPHLRDVMVNAWPEGSKLSLPTPFPNIVRAWIGDDASKTVNWSFNADATQIQLLPAAPVEVPLHLLVAEKTTQFDDGTLVLSALDSKVIGSKAKLESHPGNHRIGFWSNASDYVTWDFEAKAGDFDVDLIYSTASPAGAEISLIVDGEILKFTLASTGSWYVYTPLPAGRIKLTGGNHHAQVRCTKPQGGAVMNLKAVVLRPRKP